MFVLALRLADLDALTVGPGPVITVGSGCPFELTSTEEFFRQ